MGKKLGAGKFGEVFAAKYHFCYIKDISRLDSWLPLRELTRPIWIIN